MRLRTRRLLIVAATIALVAAMAAPAHAARVVNGAITPGKLKGKPTAVMFFHPF
jgi:hypothetical protein